MPLNANKVGLVWGTGLAVFHLIWSILVITGIGQIFMDIVLWMHMIHMPMTIGPFVLSASLSLVVFTFIVGYCMGYVVALIWNKVHGEAHQTM